MDCFHLLYYSKATSIMTQEDLSKILATAKRENSKNGVTGFLVYRDHFFLQLLEGDEDRVRKTLDRIHRDPRHSFVTVIGEYKSGERLMGDWSMASVNVEKLANSGASLIDLFDGARGKAIFETREAFELALKKFSKQAHYVIENGGYEKSGEHSL
jgi:hypothetical protein